MRVHAYLTEREATLYLDTSGEPLFKRGWRRDADEAPLRENLAAGLLALAGWTPGTPLLDPMCGSGTIAIEAALIAADRRAGTAAHVRLPEARVVRRPDVAANPAACARPRSRPAPAAPSIFASDIDPRAIAQCRRNAAAAGVARVARRSSEADVLARSAPAPAGLLVANPPYGVRLDDEHALAAFYPQARRRAEAALRRLDRVPPDRRRAACRS